MVVFRRLEWGSVKNAKMVVELLTWLYIYAPTHRAQIRHRLGDWLESQLSLGDSIKNSHIEPTLKVNF